jgi:colanic acid/amylovoran biosynthesis glycosyltransferase
MQTKTLLVLTSRFPYEGGEYFLETEQRSWKEADGIDVYLMPFFNTKALRDYPRWIALRSENSRDESRVGRFKYICAAIFSPIFFREISSLLREKKARPIYFLIALHAVSRVLQIKKAIEALAKEVGGIDVVYSYWNNTSAYAAALAKKKGLVRKIVSRAHGTDLYRYALKGGYMPLKDQLVDQFDLVAAVSKLGRDYYVSEYNISPDRVIVERLGVEIDGRLSSVTGSCQLSIVSISNCVEIKRLDVIAAGILLYARQNPDVRVHWVHIGDGPTLNDLQAYWRSSSVLIKNASAVFRGRLENKQVIDFLVHNSCDVILNASASEGVPVSLMEAMSLGIPAIAPAIGGIPELVSPSCGFLLPPMPTPPDIVNGLDWALNCAKEQDTRCAAASKVAAEYSAAKNYSQFYGLVLEAF